MMRDYIFRFSFEKEKNGEKVERKENKIRRKKRDDVSGGRPFSQLSHHADCSYSDIAFAAAVAVDVV